MTIQCDKDRIIRSVSDSDTENILRWRNSENVKKFFNYQKEITEAEHKEWLKEKVYKGFVHQFVIYDESLKKDIGSVYLKNVDNVNRKAEYGVFIGERDAIGRGIGTIIAQAMIKYAFNTLHLHRLYLQVHKDNLGAIRCYEKAGFKKEAILKDDIFVNGRFCDIIIMGIVNN